MHITHAPAHMGNTEITRLLRADCTEKYGPVAEIADWPRITDNAHMISNALSHREKTHWNTALLLSSLIGENHSDNHVTCGNTNNNKTTADC